MSEHGRHDPSSWLTHEWLAGGALTERASDRRGARTSEARRAALRIHFQRATWDLRTTGTRADCGQETPQRVNRSAYGWYGWVSVSATSGTNQMNESINAQCRMPVMHARTAARDATSRSYERTAWYNVSDTRILVVVPGRGGAELC